MSGNIGTDLRKITCGEMVWIELSTYNFQQQVVELWFEPLGSNIKGQETVSSVPL